MDDQELKTVRRRVEQKWRRKLLSEASSEDFRQAYEELGSLHSSKTRVDLSAVDKIILGKVGSHKHVLEAGFGDGRLLVALAKQGNRVVGIEISPVKMRRVKVVLDSNPVSDLHVIYGDARDLVFKDSSFDYIISQNLIEHLSADDGRKHLVEAHRILKGDGCYLFAVPSRITTGYRSVGFHLCMYSLQEMIRLVSSLGFKAKWIEPKLIKWFKIQREIPSTWLAPVCWFERILESTRRILSLQGELRIRRRKIAPTVMLAAYKDL